MNSFVDPLREGCSAAHRPENRTGQQQQQQFFTSSGSGRRRSRVAGISPLEGHLRRSGGRRTSTPGRRDSVLSLARTLLAAGRRAQGAGREGKTFAERVDEVCLHLTAGRFDQEAGGGAEGGEGGEGAVAGLSTLLFLLCHSRTKFRRCSRRRSGLDGAGGGAEVDGFVQGARGC